MGECLILKSGGGTDTSDATATADKILSGYTAYVNDQKLIGEMPNNGEVSETITPGNSHTVNPGYYSGGTVSVSSLASQTDANATASQILNSYTAWVKGSLVTGIMTNRGTVKTSLAANGTYTIPTGWHKGDGYVNQSLTTQPAASITPGTGNKVACEASRWTIGAVTVAGNSNLSAGNIKKGVKIFGITGTWTGWVDSNVYIIKDGALVNGAWYTQTNSYSSSYTGKSSGGYYWIPMVWYNRAVVLESYVWINLGLRDTSKFVINQYSYSVILTEEKSGTDDHSALGSIWQMNSSGNRQITTGQVWFFGWDTDAWNNVGKTLTKTYTASVTSKKFTTSSGVVRFGFWDWYNGSTLTIMWAKFKYLYVTVN